MKRIRSFCEKVIILSFFNVPDCTLTLSIVPDTETVVFPSEVPKSTI